MAEDLKLLQAMSARICHDLAGSIGIIDNCLSLLDTKNKSIGHKAKLLVNEESDNLIRKIKFFRSVYGASEGEKEMSAVHLNKLIKDFFINSSIKPKLHFEEGIIYLDSLLAKASICLAIIVTEHINADGKVELFFSHENSEKLVNVIANGKELRLKKESFLILTGNNTDEEGKELNINANNCREHYINNVCKNAGYKITASKKEGCLEYNIIRV